MSKRKKHEEHEEENSERWLLTYSDLITLLFALFVILYSMAVVDAKKFNAVAEQFREKMGQSTSGGKGDYDLPPGDIISEEIDIKGSGQGTALEQIYEAMQGYISNNGLQDQISLESGDNFVQIHIKDKLMFVPDSSRLLDPNNPILENIEKAVAQIYSEVDYITFTGHTADVGNDSLMGDQTAWRLSTERALTVLNRFISYGLPQNKLSIQGFAHFDPIADNSTEEGRAQNRRVEITIVKEAADTGENPVESESTAQPQSQPTDSISEPTSESKSSSE